MTREELAREAAGRTGLTVKEVRGVLDALLHIVGEALCRGEGVFLRGFGSFNTKKGKKRRIRDPRTGGIMEVPVRYRPVFKPYPTLRNAVQNSLAPKTRVAFFCVGHPDASEVFVSGNFNDWSENATPMQRLPDGSWFAELTMTSGSSIRYLFLVDGVPRPDPAYPPDAGGVSFRQV